MLTTFDALYLAESTGPDSKLHVGSVGSQHMFFFRVIAEVQKSKPSYTNAFLVSDGVQSANMSLAKANHSVKLKIKTGKHTLSFMGGIVKSPGKMYGYIKE